MNAEARPRAIGRYSVQSQLGQGAMGRVLLAKDPVLDREVAIKLLRDDLKIPRDQKASLVKRMRQEARASARVSHPNIVALHDMGEDDELGLYLVFEYAEGTTLKQRLQSGPLPARLAARLAREIGSALTTAHRAGVLHRDIKPDNIILTQTGAKIADFGIARVPDSTLTRDGGLLGTPAYSSPESIASGTFSPLSDQFSMAATLYEAIAGVRAFPGQDAIAVATKIATEPVAPIASTRSLGVRVDEVLARGLAKTPERRFPSALEFGEALAESLDTNPRASLPTMPDQRHLEEALRGRSPRMRALLGGAALGVLLTITAFRLTAELRPAPEDPSGLQSPSSVPTPTHERAAAGSSKPIGWLAESPPKAKPRHPESDVPKAPRTAPRGSAALAADLGEPAGGTRKREPDLPSTDRQPPGEHSSDVTGDP